MDLVRGMVRPEVRYMASKVNSLPAVQLDSKIVEFLRVPLRLCHRTVCVNVTRPVCNKTELKHTGVIHGSWEHVETKQPIRIQVIQQTPPRSYIRTVKTTPNPPALTMGCPHKKGYSEICLTRAQCFATVVETRWQHSVADKVISYTQATEEVAHIVILALVVIPENLEDHRRSLECDDRLQKGRIKTVSVRCQPGVSSDDKRTFTARFV